MIYKTSANFIPDIPITGCSRWLVHQSTNWHTNHLDWHALISGSMQANGENLNASQQSG